MTSLPADQAAQRIQRWWYAMCLRPVVKQFAAQGLYVAHDSDNESLQVDEFNNLKCCLGHCVLWGSIRLIA